MVSKEIQEKVYNFIAKNEDKTKNQVVKGCSDVATRLPILEAIHELMKGGKVSYRPKPRAKSFYHLYINDTNEFNRLVTLIDETSKAIQMVIGLGKFYKEGFANPSGPFRFRLVHAAQLILHNKIVKIAQAIDHNIKSGTDREMLFSRLIRLLLDSSNLDTHMIPLALIDHAQAISQIRDPNLRKEQIKTREEVEQTLIKLMQM